MKRSLFITCFLIIFTQYSIVSANEFSTAFYFRIYEVEQMKDSLWLDRNWKYLSKDIDVDKVYFEVHRSRHMADLLSIKKGKSFFESKGIKVSAGIATVKDEDDNYRTFCYSKREDVEYVEKVVEFAAKYFDEIIFDDFFFINCKCDQCISKKGTKTWSAFRLGLMSDMSKRIVALAKKINPKVRIIIKYPNWYEHFPALGYNLEEEPKIFDNIYTGSETRDPLNHPQHLQTYQSYSIVRYLENVSPGKNAGTWVDPYYRGTLDCYSDQLLSSLYAKPKEITLFCSYDLEESLNVYNTDAYLGTIAPTAASALFRMKQLFPLLGTPIGVQAYKPFHSSGEDYLHSYLGMIGIPMEMTPYYPQKSNTIFISECGKYDNSLVDKIKESLLAGKNIVITSGLLKANPSLMDIIEVKYTDRKASIDGVVIGGDKYALSHGSISIPQIEYPTNECWELITGTTKGGAYPLLLMGYYGKGKIYVLTIPENYSELYLFPREMYLHIKDLFNQELPVTLDAPANVSLFVYDNNSFVIHSYLSYPQKVTVKIRTKVSEVCDLVSKKVTRVLSDGDSSYSFEITVPPHSFQSYSFK